MCWRISRDTAVKYLEYASLSAAASGVLIALVGLTLVSWTSIIPKADQCIETWPSTNITTQCTFERKTYSEDIPKLDKAATGVVKFMQAAVAAVGFCVAVMFLPPLFAACAKKRGHVWREKCCGFIACFSTFIGFGCAVACVVIPFSAKLSMDAKICGPMLPKMKKAKAAMSVLENDVCTVECIAAITAFIESLCGLGNKFLIVAIVGFLTSILATLAFLTNAISCCVTSKGAKVQPDKQANP